MSSTKNSTDWLHPIELDEKESEVFQKTMERPLNKARRKQQAMLLEIARKIMD